MISVLSATEKLPARLHFMWKKTLIVFAVFLFLTVFSGSHDRLDASSRSMLPSAGFEDNSLLPEGAYAISTYDNLFRNICGREGNDWRLLSAIAYHESRFMPALRSPRGACGIMQIMPSVARHFQVDPERMGDLGTNIWLANRLLNELAAMLRLPAGIAEEDRLSLLLAAYNSGIGHVNDARRLALAHGENPDSWPVVSRYLALKADPAYYNHEAVRNGRFTGAGRTTAYVAEVRSRYAAYCRRAAR